MNSELVAYQYFERVKSNLIHLSRLLSELEKMKGDEYEGGRKIILSYLDGILNELKMSSSVVSESERVELERKIMECIGHISTKEIDQAFRSLGEAIALISNLASKRSHVMF